MRAAIPPASPHPGKNTSIIVEARGGMACRMRGAEYLPALQCRPASLRQRGRRAFHGAGARVPRHVPGPAAAAGAFRHKRRYMAGPPCCLSFTKPFSAGRPVPCVSLPCRPCGTLCAEGPAFSYSV
ncbi:MAG: hypothetical protein DBY17_07395 [Oscillospiraceae bacterium]|nr:MAG: hypothetical protein DBY17_07395 [Oscillospiraceae bacterium]